MAKPELVPETEYLRKLTIRLLLDQERERFDALLEKGRTTWNWDDRVPIYREVVQTLEEDVPILYLSKTIIAVAYREFLKGFGAGAATWFGYYGGGMKKVWLEKA